ncbi:MAG: response regulator [Piscinibacter sp.]|uniref:response regulator n=1 Tax=Piscinibacter sp. TaxID=1903157 RepID=UPI0011D7E198|nr:response regulator [Piscinibacter sp.]MBP5991135.1 response regulator [Piscinibacter sp.]MBP6028347.1 response regulator [Piscinibacter sp.]TXH58527.1 MAG: response regulator [Burkholderiaceae bacterium]
MTPPSLLVVDDEAELLSLLSEYFGRQGLRVRTANDAATARAIVAAEVPQVAVIDVHMPGEDGLSLARWLRVEHPGLGIVMLSTASEAVDRIVGLEVGADDYLAKPFELRELLARVKSLLRRMQHGQAVAPAPVAPRTGAVPASTQVAFGTCRLDLDKRRLFDAEGREVVLTASELDLMLLFARNPGRPLNRDQIMERAHNRSWDVFDRSIDLRIMRLRRKVERNPEKPEVIKTVRGVGYMFVPEGGA